MTENEVFEGIHKDCGSLEICNYKETGCGDCIIRQTLINAEKALEEIQQYRAIGTVEDLKDLLIVISEGQDDVDESGVSVGLLDTILEYAKYAKIGTIEEVKALKEKGEPKKIKGTRFAEAICPKCESELFETYWAFGGIHYCSNCGQAIDWQ